MFPKVVIETNSDSKSEQHNSDTRQISSEETNNSRNLDALTKKIQVVNASCKMEKENVFQLKIWRCYRFQNFTKAFRKNWNFNKKKESVHGFIYWRSRKRSWEKDNLGSFTQVCLNLFHYMCFKIYLANKSCWNYIYIQISF